MTNNQTLNNADLKRIVLQFVKVWYLYFLFGIAFLSIALVYLKFAGKTYRSTAKVVLNIDDNNYSPKDDKYFDVSSLINQETSIQNEISRISSTPLIKEVIRDMDLKISYYQKEDKIPKEFTFSFRNIFRNSPFIIVPTDNHIQPLDVYFYVKILNDEQFSIYTEEEEVRFYNYLDESTINTYKNFKLNGTFEFGQIIENKNCSFKMLLNSNYNEAEFKGKDLFFKFNSIHGLATSFKNSLTVENSSIESTILNLYFESENPSISVIFLANLIDRYVSNNLRAKNYLATKTIEYIDFQLSNISDSLGRSERALQNFRRNYNVMDINEKASTLVNQIQILENDRDDIQTRLGYLEQINEYFELNDELTTIMAPSSIGLNDPLLNSLIQELTTLSTEKQQIISNGQLNNPRLKTLNTSINNLKTAIKDNINFSITSTSNELNEIESRISNLRAEYNRLPQTQRQLLGIERQFNLNDAVYTSLLEKRIQAEISRASNLPDSEIIEPAEYAGIAAPNRMIVLAIPIILAILLPTLFVFAFAIFSDKLRDREELLQLTHFRVLGDLIFNKKGEKNVVHSQPKSIIAESIQYIASNIKYYLLGKSNSIILVTSTIPNEGKTFISLNLATSFARNHKKTLLVDFDLRKANPVLNKLSGDIKIGISNYLLDKEISINDIVNHTEIKNLDFISSGEIAPNPIELISMEQTKIFIDELRKQYDHIIFDTPPLGFVTDPFILMSYSDINLFIAKLGYSKKSSLKQTLADLENKNIENVHLIINNSNKSAQKYAYEKYAQKNSRQEKLLRAVSFKRD